MLVLAGAAARSADSPWLAGVVATVSWAFGLLPGPVTGRDEKPVTRELAEAELWAAAAVPGPRPPLEQICAERGVAYWPVRPVGVEWADGAWRTLRWLLGRPGQGPPVPIPVRNPDGSLVMADQLYAEALARFSMMPPEDRQQARLEAERTVEHSRQLAQRVTDTLVGIFDQLPRTG